MRKRELESQLADAHRDLALVRSELAGARADAALQTGRNEILAATLVEVREQLKTAEADLRKWMGLDETPLEGAALYVTEDAEIRKAREARAKLVDEQLAARGVDVL